MDVVCHYLKRGNKMNKNIIIVWMIVIVTFAIVLIFRDDLFNGKIENEKNEELIEEKIQEYYVYGYNTVLSYDGQKWEYVEPNDIQWKQFDIFDGNDYLGNYSLQYNKKWYVLILR